MFQVNRASDETYNQREYFAPQKAVAAYRRVPVPRDEQTTARARKRFDSAALRMRNG